MNHMDIFVCSNNEKVYNVDRSHFYFILFFCSCASSSGQYLEPVSLELQETTSWYPFVIVNDIIGCCVVTS